MKRDSELAALIEEMYGMEEAPALPVAAHAPVEEVDLHSYAIYVVFMSGGKDSIALLLFLLEAGIAPDQIELHHHLVDGDGENFMDWPITSAYCQAIADHFGIRLYNSYRVGGFEGEMLRENGLTGPVAFDSEDGTRKVMGGNRGKPNTRMQFPQVTADLSQRWCSSSLKIDVGARVICNETRFLNNRTLVLTGERAEESTSRAKYAKFERYRADRRDSKKLRRHVDVLRAVHDWPEAKVWDIMRRHRIRPHPAYQIGFSRVSCRECIFDGPNEWATIKLHFPPSFNKVSGYEKRFNKTIHRTRTIEQTASMGVPFQCDAALVALADSTVYTESIVMDDWQLPQGAFKKGCGPT